MSEPAIPVSGHQTWPAVVGEQLSCGHHVSLCFEPDGIGAGAVCALCAAEAKVARLEAVLRFVQRCAVQCPACRQYVDAALSGQEKP